MPPRSRPAARSQAPAPRLAPFTEAHSILGGLSPSSAVFNSRRKGGFRNSARLRPAGKANTRQAFASHSEHDRLGMGFAVMLLGAQEAIRGDVFVPRLCLG